MQSHNLSQLEQVVHGAVVQLHALADPSAVYHAFDRFPEFSPLRANLESDISRLAALRKSCRTLTHRVERLETVYEDVSRGAPEPLEREVNDAKKQAAAIDERIMLILEDIKVEQHARQDLSEEFARVPARTSIERRRREQLLDARKRAVEILAKRIAAYEEDKRRAAALLKALRSEQELLRREFTKAPQLDVVRRAIELGYAQLSDDERKVRSMEEDIRRSLREFLASEHVMGLLGVQSLAELESRNQERVRAAAAAKRLIGRMYTRRSHSDKD
jgi:hypothetical protein